MLHSWATTTDDATVDPRWGKVGKQKIEDAGELCPKRMETVDDEIRDMALKFIDKAKADNKPFFLWLNPTRMHIVTHLSPKYQAMRNSKNGWSIHEAGMAQLDDDIGLVMKKLKDMGVDDNTIVIFTTDNGTEVFTWPDGGQTPFAQSKGTVMEGGFRAPAMIRWPGKVPAGKVENGLISGLDWFPTLVAAAGNPNIGEELKKGKQLGDRTYKVYLDGYNQMDLITGKGPSNRDEIWYFGESELGAVRIGDYKYRFIDQPGGWLGEKTKPDVPYLTNLRLDPFERTGWPNNGTKEGAQQYFDWFKYEFWRFVFVQQQVEKLAMTAVEFPPMQKGASFNLDAARDGHAIGRPSRQAGLRRPPPGYPRHADLHIIPSVTLGRPGQVRRVVTRPTTRRPTPSSPASPIRTYLCANGDGEVFTHPTKARSSTYPQGGRGPSGLRPADGHRPARTLPASPASCLIETAMRGDQNPGTVFGLTARHRRRAVEPRGKGLGAYLRHSSSPLVSSSTFASRPGLAGPAARRSACVHGSTTSPFSCLTSPARSPLGIVRWAWCRPLPGELI